MRKPVSRNITTLDREKTMPRMYFAELKSSTIILLIVILRYDYYNNTVVRVINVFLQKLILYDNIID